MLPSRRPPPAPAPAPCCSSRPHEGRPAGLTPQWDTMRVMCFSSGHSFASFTLSPWVLLWLALRSPYLSPKFVFHSELGGGSNTSEPSCSSVASFFSGPGSFCSRRTKGLLLVSFGMFFFWNPGGEGSDVSPFLVALQVYNPVLSWGTVTSATFVSRVSCNFLFFNYSWRTMLY